LNKVEYDFVKSLINNLPTKVEGSGRAMIEACQLLEERPALVRGYHVVSIFPCHSPLHSFLSSLILSSLRHRLHGKKEGVAASLKQTL
jgi:hypothetical protein